MMNEDMFGKAEVMATVRNQKSLQTAYSGWKYKKPHGPVLFFGCTRERVRTPAGDERFAAVILKRIKGYKGRKCHVPIAVAFLKCPRVAIETALLWCCRQHGIELDPQYEPGSMPKNYRIKLYKQLNIYTHRSSLSALPPILSELLENN